MKFLTQNKNILICVLVTLAIINIAYCGKWKTTPKKSFEGGSIFALAKHDLNCPNKHGMTHFQAQKSGNNFWFRYQCYGACKGLKVFNKSYEGTTKANATDGNKKRSLHYLDRHSVQCKNGYSLQSFGLKQQGNQIFYKFKCTETKCSKRTTYKTPSPNMGQNETKFYPRLMAKAPKFHQVITGFRFHRQRGNDFHYHVSYCVLNHKFKTPKKPKGKKLGKKPRRPNGRKPAGKGKKPRRPTGRKPTGRRPAGGRPTGRRGGRPNGRPNGRPIPQIGNLPGANPYNEDLPTVMALTPAANLAVGKGNKFCSQNCVVNMARRTRLCLLGNKTYNCKRCVINPTKNDAMANNICSTVCDSVGFNRPCEFFGYYNGSKKNVSGAALKKFGLALIRRR